MYYREAFLKRDGGEQVPGHFHVVCYSAWIIVGIRCEAFIKRDGDKQVPGHFHVVCLSAFLS